MYISTVGMMTNFEKLKLVHFPIVLLYTIQLTVTRYSASYCKWNYCTANELYIEVSFKKKKVIQNPDRINHIIEHNKKKNFKRTMTLTVIISNNPNENLLK